MSGLERDKWAQEFTKKIKENAIVLMNRLFVTIPF